MYKFIDVNDSDQKNYSYGLSEKMGHNFDSRFKPELSPEDMLRLGVFGGSYLNDCQAEFPKSWFKQAKLSDAGPDFSLNYFKVKASQPLSVWQRKGWIYEEDPRGWFQWYCRYYLGRRIPEEDDRQIKRWLAMTRHITQVRNHCRIGDEKCRPRQRQALLHWAYDSRKI
jgi:hypothetical protein